MWPSGPFWKSELPALDQADQLNPHYSLNNLAICVLAWGLADPKVTWKRVLQTASAHPNTGDGFRLALLVNILGLGYRIAHSLKDFAG